MQKLAEYWLVSNGQAVKKYVLTGTDIEWLARSIWGEEGDRMTREAAGGVAWTMLNRFLRWPGGRWHSFTDLIRSFSQPVNTAWIDPKGGLCPSHQDQCTPAHIARRRRTTHTAWSDVPYAPKLYAQAFAEGYLPNPLAGKGVVDFAGRNSSGVCLSSLSNPITIPTCGECFYRDRDSKRTWLPGEAMIGSRVATPLQKLVGFTLGVLAGLGLTRLYKKWRRKGSHKR